MSEEYTGYTVSFRPGGKDYDSPLVVVRANTVSDLLEKLEDAGPNEDLAAAVYDFDQMLKGEYGKDEESGKVAKAAHGTGAIVTFPTVSTTPSEPIWVSGSGSGPLTPNPDGTYPPCPHGSAPRKPWTSPRNGKKYLFCKLPKGSPGACESVVL